MRALGHIRTKVAGTGAQALALPRRELLLSLAVAVVLVAGPVVLTLARSRTFTTSVEVFTFPVRPFAAPRPTPYVNELLKDRLLRRTVDDVVRGSPTSALRSVRLRPTRVRPSITLSASGDTPQEARDLVNAIGTKLAQGSANDVERKARARRVALQRRLSRSAPPERARLSRSLDRIDRILRQRRSHIALGPRPEAPEPTRWADRLVDTLPGSFPARPSPFLAGLAGLALTAAFGALVLLRRRRILHVVQHPRTRS